MKRLLFGAVLALACARTKRPQLALPPPPREGSPASLSRTPSEDYCSVLLRRTGTDPCARETASRDSAAKRHALEHLHATLRRIEAAMRPVCRPKCGIVALAFEERDDCELCAEPTISGTFTTIRIQRWYASELAKGPPERAYWALAHEYGHHLDFTVGGRGHDDQWGAELRAEALAGCAIVRGNVVSDEQIDNLRAWVEARRDAPAPTHPAELAHPHPRFLERALLIGVESCTGMTPTVDDIAEATDPVVTASWLSATRLDR